MRKGISILLVLFFVFGLVGCSNSVIKQDELKKKSVELFLPQLTGSYNSVYEHWGELSPDKITLMDKPLLVAKDIKKVGEQEIKVKKNFIIVDGKGLDNGLIYDDKKLQVLEFSYNGKQYKIDRTSSKLFCNYTIHGVCVVVDGDDIFFVKQREFKKSEGKSGEAILEREYSKGAIGIPYVLVVDGKRTELGILKVGEGEFAVPKEIDSWCYMGFPNGLNNLVPEGDKLRKENNEINYIVPDPVDKENP